MFEEARNSSLASQICEDFLKRIMNEHGAVSVFLSTGVKLQGQIIDFDKYCLQLACGRDSILTIVPTAYITSITERSVPSGNYNDRNKTSI